MRRRFSYTIYPENSKINTHTFGLINVGDWERETNANFSYRVGGSYRIAFANTSRFSVELENVYRKLLFPFTFTQNPLAAQGYKWRTFGVEYQSDIRKVFNYSIGGGIGGFYSGKRKNLTAEINYQIQPNFFEMIK